MQKLYFPLIFNGDTEMIPLAFIFILSLLLLLCSMMEPNQKQKKVAVVVQSVWFTSVYSVRSLQARVI